MWEMKRKKSHDHYISLQRPPHWERAICLNSILNSILMSSACMSGPLFQCRFNYTHFYLCFTSVSGETLIFFHLSHFSNLLWLCRTAVTREIFEFRTPEQIKGEQNTNYGLKTTLSTTTTSKWFQDENFSQWIGCGEGLSCMCRIAFTATDSNYKSAPSPRQSTSLHYTSEKEWKMWNYDEFGKFPSTNGMSTENTQHNVFLSMAQWNLFKTPE